MGGSYQRHHRLVSRSLYDDVNMSSPCVPHNFSSTDDISQADKLSRVCNFGRGAQLTSVKTTHRGVKYQDLFGSTEEQLQVNQMFKVLQGIL